MKSKEDMRYGSITIRGVDGEPMMHLVLYDSKGAYRGRTNKTPAE
jgi:hypothetical protein